MKIALVTTSFLPRVGGAEFVIHHLAQQWVRQGHEVCVFNTVCDRPTEAGALYRVHRYSVLNGTSRFGAHRFPFSWYASRRLAHVLGRYRPDFISGHFGYPVGIWLSRMVPSRSYLITCHGPALNETPQGPRQRYGVDHLVAQALNRSVGAVAISSDARRIMERIGVQPSKIVDIPNGVDLERFRAPVLFDLRAKFGLPWDAVVVLTVGRSMWAKAHDTGLKAFAQVVARAPNTFYVLLGRDTGQWLPLAKKLGIAAKVVFCDGLYGGDLVGAYQQADLFFLPSVKELCPMVVPEAMGAGLPAVVTNISGSQDMVKTGENGFVVEPGDVPAMVKALLSLVEDRALRERMGAAARDRSEQYSWDRIARAYLECA